MATASTVVTHSHFCCTDVMELQGRADRSRVIIHPSIAFFFIAQKSQDFNIDLRVECCVAV